MAQEHKHGEMDITVQEQTFINFIMLTAKTTAVIIVAVILLALINA